MKAEFKSEYWDGQIYAMAGGSPRHSELGALFTAAAVLRLKGKGCGVFTSDLRIFASINDGYESLYTYPDVSIVFGRPEFGESQTLINPTVLVEVLSPSTEGSDRGPKFERYQHIASLREYVLISQEKPRVEVFVREPDGTWRYQSIVGLRSILTLASVGIEIPLSEIYDGLMFREWFTTDPAA